MALLLVAAFCLIWQNAETDNRLGTAISYSTRLIFAAGSSGLGLLLLWLVERR